MCWCVCWTRVAWDLDFHCFEPQLTCVTVEFNVVEHLICASVESQVWSLMTLALLVLLALFDITCFVGKVCEVGLCAARPRAASRTREHSPYSGCHTTHAVSSCRVLFSALSVSNHSKQLSVVQLWWRDLGQNLMISDWNNKSPLTSWNLHMPCLLVEVVVQNGFLRPGSGCLPVYPNQLGAFHSQRWPSCAFAWLSQALLRQTRGFNML